MLKKRRLVFLCIPLLLFCVLIFHRPLICFALKHAVARQLKFLKFSHVSYGHLGYNEGVVYLDNIQFSHPLLHEELLYIKKLECQIWLAHPTYTFHTAYKILQPVLKWRRENIPFVWQELDFYKILSLPPSVKKLTIESGSIECITQEGVTSVHFSFVPGRESTHIGSIFVGITDQEEEHMSLHLYQQAKNILLQMELCHMPLLSVNSLYLPSGGNLHLKQGYINGEVQLGITSDRKLHSFKSDLALHELLLVGKHDASLLQLSECRFRAVLPLKHHEQIDLGRFTLPMLMRYLVSTCEWEGGNIRFNNPQTHSLWNFSDLEGMFTCNLAHTPNLSIKGQLGKDQALHPFTLEGKGVVESEQNWWMDLEMSPLTKKKHGIEAARIPVYVALLDGKEYFIKASLRDLETSALQMIQDLTQIWLPSLQTFQVLKGSINTDMVVRIQDKNINTVAFESLSCSGLEGIWHKKNVKISCDELKGKVKLHFPVFKNNKAPLWEIAFQNLSVKNSLGRELLESSGDISSKDWKVASSWITTKLEGIEGEWNISGPYTELELRGSLLLSEQHLASSLQEEVMKIASHMERLEKIECFLKIKYEQQQFQIMGRSHLGYTHSVVDQLRFGIKMTLEEMRQGRFFHEGWFQSDQLSEHTYLWGVKYYKQRWHALGNMKVTGEFNTQKVHFTLESEKALYDSEDILVKMDPQAGAHTGDFIFDLHNKSWLIHLPIRGAECIDKRFQLPFKDVDTDVKIEGMRLAAEHIQAVCEQVAFEGRLDLDFTDPEWIDLKLYPNRIQGEVQDCIRFMRYLPEFAHLHVPLEGKVVGDPDNYLFTRYNLTESSSTSKLALTVQQGKYPLSTISAVHNVSFDLLWDSSAHSLEIKELGGDVYLLKDQEQRQYRFNAQNLIAKNLTAGEWDFDLRLEAPTFDILRIAGHTQKIEEDYVVHLEPHLTHFFGAKLQQVELAVSPSFDIKRFALTAAVSSTDLMSQLQFAYLAGVLECTPSFVQEIKNMKTDGDLFLAVSHDAHHRATVIDIKSQALTFDQISMQDLSLKIVHHKKKWVLEYLKTKELSAYAEAELQGDVWELSALQAQWKQSFLAVKQGTYAKGCLTLQLDQLSAHLGEIQELIGWRQEKKIWLGTLSAQGTLSVDASEGIKRAKLFSELSLYSQALGVGRLEMISKTPVKIAYSHQNGIEMEQFNMHFQKQELQEVWALTEMRYLQMYPHEKTVIAKGIKILLPPEMLRYLVQLNFIPHVEVIADQFHFFEKTFKWENQIETAFDLVYDPHSIQVQGFAKDGYYWIGENSVYFQNIHYFLDQDQLNLAFGWDYQGISLDFLTQIQIKEGIEALKEGMAVKVMIKEGHVEDQDARSSLDIVCRYSHEEGLNLQSIEGSLYGIDFSFRRNPRAYLPDVMILTGQMKVDTAGLVKAFPKLFYQTVKDLGMGSGYELSGDWVFSKKEISSSYFKGFLKGRDFEFLGFYFKTLLSEVEINNRGVTVHDFRLSDWSGVAQMKEARISKSEAEGSWKLEIPEIMVQDFRPSFLKKGDGQEERIKPFVIKDLHFFDIQGTLGHKESFSGGGHLDFINTFKRETNLLDLPIEIIGRIGFDLGLFVPVIGKIEFEMTEGKIFLRELTNAYSEGKRSRFYLSGYKDSYIGLDGSVFIDIKMKQYVLLKITQPFTLSVRGTLTKPKYSLR